MHILPAIIEDTYDEVAKKLTLVASFVDWAQVDIGDGVFVAHRTWTQVEELAQAPVRLNIDLHIMVDNPHAYIERVRNIPNIRRITFHYEATDEHRAIIAAIHAIGREAAVAINPETPVEHVTPLISSLDAVLVMGVTPGWGGQGFLPETPSRITAVKTLTRSTNMKVGADGGIHLVSGSAQACVNAGADFLVVGSGIFGATDPAEAIKQFQGLFPHHS